MEWWQALVFMAVAFVSGIGGAASYRRFARWRMDRQITSVQRDQMKARWDALAKGSRRGPPLRPGPPGQPHG